MKLNMRCRSIFNLVRELRRNQPRLAAACKPQRHENLGSTIPQKHENEWVDRNISDLGGMYSNDNKKDNTCNKEG